ncbi:MAG: hypothetical protein IJ092_07165 [Atopobiaceae bacterium]|nr:hypothetical protein [Atopobiaceae bacterium]
MVRKTGSGSVRRSFVTSLLAWALMGALLLGVPSLAKAKGEPLADDPYSDSIALAWEDGTYLVDVSMEGGSGKASVSSPAKVSVKEGKAAAEIEWSSPNYDYMVVAGKTYLPINEGGNSVFLIPLLSIDEPFDVVGDTTAMSKPHEVAYRLAFDSASAVEAGSANALGNTFPLPVMVGCVAAVGGVLALLARKKQ